MSSAFGVPHGDQSEGLREGLATPETGDLVSNFPDISPSLRMPADCGILNSSHSVTTDGGSITE